MKEIITECCSDTVGPNYVPPPIGNGDLSVQIDMEGIQRQKKYCDMIPGIYRAGRRYDRRGYALIPFGYILQDTKEPETWRQQLDVTAARVRAECEYADGSILKTEAFAHLAHPMLAIRKKFPGKYVFRYVLAQPGEERLPPKHMEFISEKTPNGFNIHFKVDGMEEYQGVISIWTSAKQPVPRCFGNEFTIEVEGDRADFFLCFHDSLDDANPSLAMRELQDEINKRGYDGMFLSHKEAWNSYWDESYVKLPSSKEETLYYTSQYHLRISSTRWSLPVGIFPSHWAGRYFSFDDHFSFMGLITSGHNEMAKRIPEFRFNTLSQAQNRAHRYFGESYSGARWYWELLEDGNTEGSPGGFWLEHIFHMANIAMSAWYYYQFSMDWEFLKEKAYPVIKACAEFYERQSVWKRSDNEFIVGKCADLERLGPGRENAYMTTCGVIATFKYAAMAAEKLDVDKEEIKNWKFLAEKLLETLPVKDERYIPYPGCEQKSVAVMAGTFPYPVIAPDDKRQRAAIADFIKSENDYGNMYPVGNSICVWYAAWKGITLGRLGQVDRARACIDQSVAEANGFTEVFEISDPPRHPWFTTAEGSYIQMVNESLIQSSANEIKIINCDRDNYAFKLPASGGIVVEAEIKNKRMVFLSITASVPYKGKITLPDGKSVEIDARPGGKKIITPRVSSTS